MGTGLLIIAIVAGLLLFVGIYDLFQVRHAILRNFSWKLSTRRDRLFHC